MASYRPLTNQEISILQANQCSAENWQHLTVGDGFDPTRVRRVSFYGDNRLGRTDGTITRNGVSLPCGLYDAVLHNCHIGDQVRIFRIGDMISNYDIADQVVIEDVYRLHADADARYGQGTEVEVLNEAGGRTVVLFDDLNAQTAYCQALFRHDPRFQANLQKLIEQHIGQSRISRGVVEQGSEICHCGELLNIRIGAAGRLHGVSRLENGAILSDPQHPTEIGADVTARNFIIAEGAKVEDGVILDKVYVGQATRLGKQFSAENAVLFANCEGFHSEVCSIFAGPYTVTHHRSTLLIASMFSFYNAGSGTNQSNHMYKLGPLHQGIFERGSKTGSFSYVLLEGHIPAFTVVIGKHLTNIDLPVFPFSYITEEHGTSMVRPAINLFAIGTVRDGAKWPSRDRRKAQRKRDRIIFDVYTPYTVEKMRQGRDLLLKLYEETPREKESIHYGGVQINRLLLSKGAKYYGMGIDRYLIEKVMSRIENAGSKTGDWSAVLQTLKPITESEQTAEWLDLSGLLARKDRVTETINAVSNDEIKSISDWDQRWQQIESVYPQDEWDYICHAFAAEYGTAPQQLTVTDMQKLTARWETAALSLASLLIDNANKEFAPFSQIGFGLGWGEEDKKRDFLAVRGEMEKHSVIKQLNDEKSQLVQRGRDFRSLLQQFS